MDSRFNSGLTKFGRITLDQKEKRLIWGMRFRVECVVSSFRVDEVICVRKKQGEELLLYRLHRLW